MLSTRYMYIHRVYQCNHMCCKLLQRKEGKIVHCNSTETLQWQKHCNAEKLQCNKIAETLQCRNIATQTQQDCRNIATQKHCNAETLQCNKRCNTKDKYCNIYCNTLAEHAATCCNKRCNWHCNTTSPQPVQQYYIMVITAFHCNKSTGTYQQNSTFHVQSFGRSHKQSSFYTQTRYVKGLFLVQRRSGENFR